eukprot:599312-Pleurochrysis_carterae.AAC.1
MPLDRAVQSVPQGRLQALRAGGSQGRQAAPGRHGRARARHVLGPPPEPHRRLGGGERRGYAAGRPRHHSAPPHDGTRGGRSSGGHGGRSRTAGRPPRRAT